MKQISFALILLFLLFACSTTQNTAKLNATLGMSRTELIETMGTPSATKILDNGTEILAYMKVDNVYVPSEFYIYNQGNLANEYDPLSTPFLNDYDFSPFGDDFGYTATYYCKTAFILKGGKVLTWEQNGNDCG